MVRLAHFMTGLLILASTSGAGAQSVFVSAEPTFPDRYIDDVAGVMSLYVVVAADQLLPVSAVRFSAPLPGCFEGATWLSDTPATPVTIGDSQTGALVAFGQCMTSAARALTINILAQGTSELCCIYGVVPDPNAASGEVEVVDCSDNLVITAGGSSVVSSKLLWIGDPYPADGATGMPMDTKLNWGVNSCGTTVGLGVAWDELHFGMTPEPPKVVSDVTMEIIQQPYDPGPLLSGTTYYWKAKWVDTDIGTVESPVWRFTTSVGVRTGLSTWGQIKALYR